MVFSNVFVKFFAVTLLFAAQVTNCFLLHLSKPWNVYKALHGKSYTEEEEARRLEVFKENVDFVTKHNIEADLGLHSFRVAANRFSDLTLEEFSKQMNGLLPEATPANRTYEVDLELNVPNEIDYRKMGMVTDVKDQGSCASCYAFAAMAALESQWKKQKKKLHDLSVQNIVDCSTTYGNRGCKGGAISTSFQYVVSNRGVNDWKTYPYADDDGTCRYKRNKVGATCRGYFAPTDSGEQGLRTATGTFGPVASSFIASSNAFKQYSSGVYDDPRGCSRGKIDHAMAVIGYGKEGGKDYWLIKNSYGKDWGERGYVKTARNKGNQCGVSSVAYFPQV